MTEWVRIPFPPGVTLSPSAATVTRALSITEEGAAATYNVQLGQQPQGAVRIQIETPSGMIFNASNWNTARVVTVEARDDANVVGETVHVTDNDTPTLRVSQRGPMALTEEESETCTVALGQPPSGIVLVEVQSSDMGVMTVNGPSSGFADLTFTTTTWNTAQTVTLTAVHDGDLTDETVTMSHEVSPDDTVDDFGSAAGVTFAVTVTDDDGLRVMPRTTTVGEGSSAGATYTVALKSQPSGAVPSRDANAVGVVLAALTFTGGASGNWGTAQTVTAGTGATNADAADRAVTLSHAVAGAAPYNYAAQAADDVTVTIDDETAVVALREGERATYTVRLSAPPAVGSFAARPASPPVWRAWRFVIRSCEFPDQVRWWRGRCQYAFSKSNRLGKQRSAHMTGTTWLPRSWFLGGSSGGTEGNSQRVLPGRTSLEVGRIAESSMKIGFWNIPVEKINRQSAHKCFIHAASCCGGVVCGGFRSSPRDKRPYGVRPCGGNPPGTPPVRGGRERP